MEGTPQAAWKENWSETRRLSKPGSLAVVLLAVAELAFVPPGSAVFPRWCAALALPAFRLFYLDWKWNYDARGIRMFDSEPWRGRFPRWLLNSFQAFLLLFLAGLALFSLASDGSYSRNLGRLRANGVRGAGVVRSFLHRGSGPGRLEVEDGFGNHLLFDVPAGSALLRGQTVALLSPPGHPELAVPAEIPHEPPMPRPVSWFLLLLFGQITLWFSIKGYLPTPPQS